MDLGTRAFSSYADWIPYAHGDMFLHMLHRGNMHHDSDLDTTCTIPKQKFKSAPPPRTGSFLAVPAGMFKADASSPAINTTYLFARNDWSAPIAHLPTLSRPSVAVRFCPVPFRSQPAASTGCDTPFSSLPYRFVLAVATMDSVILYDTQV